MFGGKCLNMEIIINTIHPIVDFTQNMIFILFFIFLGSLSGQNYLSMIFFNDKVSPANISFLTRYGLVTFFYYHSSSIQFFQ